jgi:hypothetical protein
MLEVPRALSFGRLPYERIAQGLAEDFWPVLKKERVDTGCFGSP